MIPKSDMDYIEHYAVQLRENPVFFKQQKLIIESQLRGSLLLFRGMFGEGGKFKINARKYLKSIERL